MKRIICPNCGSIQNPEDYIRTYVPHDETISEPPIEGYVYLCDCGCRFTIWKHPELVDGMVLGLDGYNLWEGDKNPEIYEKYNNRPIPERTYYIGYNDRFLYNVPFEIASKLYPDLEKVKLEDDWQVVDNSQNELFAISRSTNRKSRMNQRRKHRWLR